MNARSNHQDSSSRPLDTLNNAKGKKVMVELKTKQRFSGILGAIDMHINTVLNEAVEMDSEGNPLRTLGKIFLRGDTIILISPQ